MKELARLITDWYPTATILVTMYVSLKVMMERPKHKLQ